MPSFIRAFWRPLNSSTRHVGWLGLWMLLCLAPVATTAYAQDGEQERARELYTNGKMLFDEGRFEEAIVAWSEAYRLSERPVLLYNIALAHSELKRFKEAIDTLYQYRIYAPKDEQAALMTEIEALKVKQAEQEGEQEEQRAAQEAADKERADAALREALSAPKKPKRTAAWAMWGGTALLATGGAVFAAISSKHGKSYDLGCGEFDGLTLCNAQAESAFSQQKQFAILADVSWGVSLASGGVALWLTLRKPNGSKKAKAAALSFHPRGIRVRGQF